MLNEDITRINAAASFNIQHSTFIILKKGPLPMPEEGGM